MNTASIDRDLIIGQILDCMSALNILREQNNETQFNLINNIKVLDVMDDEELMLTHTNFVELVALCF